MAKRLDVASRLLQLGYLPSRSCHDPDRYL